MQYQPCAVVLGSVCEHDEVLIRLKCPQELLTDPLLLISVVGPERESGFLVAFDDNHANKIIESFVRFTFDVEVDVDGSIGQLRRSEYIDPLVSECKSL